MSKELIDGMLAAMGNGIVNHLTQLSGGAPVSIMLHVVHADGQVSCTHNMQDEDYDGLVTALALEVGRASTASLDEQRAEALAEAELDAEEATKQ